MAIEENLAAVLPLDGILSYPGSILNRHAHTV